MKISIKSLLIAVLLLLTGTALHAQDSGSADINASANVLDAITVNGVAPLTFGDVARNNTSSIAATDNDNRGQFTILGSDRTVLLTFTLPTDLTDGTNNLPISFSDTDAIWNNGGPDTSFDPNVADIEATIADGDVDVFIGGTVDVDEVQAAGNYTGTITLTAEYDL